MTIHVSGTNETADQYFARRAEEEAAEARRLGLTMDELLIAKQTGMSPERYAAMKGVRNIRDYRSMTEAE